MKYQTALPTIYFGLVLFLFESLIKHLYCASDILLVHIPCMVNLPIPSNVYFIFPFNVVWTSHCVQYLSRKLISLRDIY